jgi:hypothetical protein
VEFGVSFYSSRIQPRFGIVFARFAILAALAMVIGKVVFSLAGWTIEWALTLAARDQYSAGRA